MQGSDWYQILEAARGAALKNKRDGKDAAFTSAELARAAKISNGPRSKARNIASAWCSKLAKWGYLEALEGTEPSPDGHRWVRVWKLTEAGRTREAPKTRSMVGRVRTRSKGRTRRS